MNLIYSICRIVLGLFFFVIGLNGFLNFFSSFYIGSELENLIIVLEKAKFFFPIFHSLEIIVASLLLFNFAVTFAALIVGFFLINFFLVYYYLIEQNFQSVEMFFFYLLVTMDFILIISKGKNYLYLLK